jgi:hypothetical protein
MSDLSAANANSTSADSTNTDKIDVFGAPTQAVATAADAQVASVVSTLSLVQQARLSNQKRAATLAVAVYGQGSTEATAAAATVTATTTAAARLTALTQRVNTAAPTVATTGWALHGRVYSSALAPQTGYAVFLVDAQKNYLSDYGYSYTDNTGYFLISYAGPAANASQSGPTSSASASSTKAASSTTSSKAAAAPTPTPAPTPAPTPTPAAPQLFLQITDAKANPVLLSESAFVPVTGQATYQSVTLPAGDTPLGDLPVDIRAVALPNLTSAPKQKAAKSAAPKTGKNS